jgi:NADP-dependent 3-hydroxy acid dehydrogenase YdfG
LCRTTSISPGFVRTELDSSIGDPAMREQIRANMNDFRMPPEAVARAIAFAIEQPPEIEISDITIRPKVQG